MDVKTMMKWIIALIGLAAGLTVVTASTQAQETDFDWRSDWAVADGFRLDIDTEGYEFPTAIVFVPNPGSGPKDPLYFVTEIRGQVKVVTNDRSIYTFAEGFTQVVPIEELPSVDGEVGAAGICLEPNHGYVFVTFVYQDSNGLLRNNIIRFQSVPETFSLEAESEMLFTDIFTSDDGAVSHQIGPCQISNDLLYVSVGDSHQAAAAQDINSTLGKILRMTLDGDPVETNPFYEDDDIKKPINYVWSYGFRNPFGLKAVEDRVFVAENGMFLDRFVESVAGENHMWNDTNWSNATNALMVFSPSLAPVQTDYYPAGSDMFPEGFRNRFYMATAGGTQEPGSGNLSHKGIVMVHHMLAENRLESVPEYFLRYKGVGFQVPVGLAFGPDGLYFVPLLPNATGQTMIFRITYDPDQAHPHTLTNVIGDPLDLMDEKGCFGCHSITGMGGGTAAPPLDQPGLTARLIERLNSEDYLASLKEVDQINGEPFVNYAEARREVAAAEPGEERVAVWLEYRLTEPKFDSPSSQMPNLHLSEEEIDVIADYLLGVEEEQTWGDWLVTTLTTRPAQPRYRHVGLAFVVGLGLGYFLIVRTRQQQK
jgi:glucose/arabinose dehydrogenase/mono/diheme cytochrome c family protein